MRRRTEHRAVKKARKSLAECDENSDSCQKKNDAMYAALQGARQEIHTARREANENDAASKVLAAKLSVRNLRVACGA